MKNPFDEIPEIRIGNQIWSKLNISLRSFRNGEEILMITDAEAWEQAGVDGVPACCFYDNNPAYENSHGLLYNSHVVLNSETIAPEGWRIPQKKDWETLLQFLGGTQKAGLALKNQTGWLPKEKDQAGNGNNATGFTALPSGYRNFLGSFTQINLCGLWWSAQDKPGGLLEYFYLDNNSDAGAFGIPDPEDGLSIRLIRD